MCEYLGIVGIFLGTFGSYILVGLWVDPYFLYKYKFSKSFMKYILSLLLNLTIIVIIGFLTYSIVSLVKNYMLKVLICFAVTNILFAAAYCKTEGFRFVYQRIRNVVKIKNKFN